MQHPQISEMKFYRTVGVTWENWDNAGYVNINEFNSYLRDGNPERENSVALCDLDDDGVRK